MSLLNRGHRGQLRERYIGTDATVKCPHCKKECDPETPEAEFICWHGLCAECELKGVRDGLNRRQ